MATPRSVFADMLPNDNEKEMVRQVLGGRACTIEEDGQVVGLKDINGEPLSKPVLVYLNMVERLHGQEIRRDLEFIAITRPHADLETCLNMLLDRDTA